MDLQICLLTVFHFLFCDSIFFRKMPLNNTGIYNSIDFGMVPNFQLCLLKCTKYNGACSAIRLLINYIMNHTLKYSFRYDTISGSCVGGIYFQNKASSVHGDICIKNRMNVRVEQQHMYKETESYTVLDLPYFLYLLPHSNCCPLELLPHPKECEWKLLPPSICCLTFNTMHVCKYICTCITSRSPITTSY